MKLHRRDKKLERILNDLKDGEPWVVIVGSAVSLRQPTCMPLASAAMESILGDLFQVWRSRKGTPNSNRSNGRGLQRLVQMLIGPRAKAKEGSLERGVKAVSKAIKFELFFAVLGDYLGEFPRQIAADLYRGIRPNVNHKAIAWIVEQGHEVFTTNFDENVQACLSGELKGRLTHMHGRAREPETMALTLKQLRPEERPELDRLRESIRRVGRVVCVGYSGFGDIDIIPVLRDAQLKRKKGPCGPDRHDGDKKQGVRFVWFDRRGFQPPVEAEVYVHDLERNDNILLRWADMCDSADAPESQVDEPSGVLDRVPTLVKDVSTSTLLRALASVAHEGRIGKLALKLYALADQKDVTCHDWAVAYERANDRRRAAECLFQEMERAPQDRRGGLLASAGFCLRQVGRWRLAIGLHEEAREKLQANPDVPYGDYDSVLRGRAGAICRVAARIGDRGKRVELICKTGVRRDLRYLRLMPDPQGERNQRLALLIDVARLQIAALSHGRLRRLSEWSRRTWEGCWRLQDVEMEATAARMAAMVDPGLGRRLVVKTLREIRTTGASRRDAGKLLFFVLVTLVPMLPPRRRMLYPRDYLQIPMVLAAELMTATSDPLRRVERMAAGSDGS